MTANTQIPDPRQLLDLMEDRGLVIIHPKQLISRDAVAALLGCCGNTVDNRTDKKHKGYDSTFPKKRKKGENSAGWIAGEVFDYIDSLPEK